MAKSPLPDFTAEEYLYFQNKVISDFEKRYSDREEEIEMANTLKQYFKDNFDWDVKIIKCKKKE